MIEQAEADGKLQPGGVVVEATAGNTGIGLALVARIKGYRVVLVVPDKMAAEKVLHLKALGAEIHLTRSDVGKGHPEYYQDYAARLAREIPGAWFADQFNNPANPRAHETTTGPELWEQSGQDLDAIVVGVGSGGTLTGLSRYFSQVQPHLEFVLADPRGSILAEYVQTGRLSEVSGSWAVEGIGEDFIPANADLSRVRTAYTITDEESFHTARALLRNEGILAGSSTGTLLAAALKYCRAQTSPKRVATFVCDTGTRYLTKVYSDGWMVDQGLLERPRLGDLRDLIGRRYDDGEVVTVSPSDTLLTAFNRMRSADLAQLPVIDQGRLAGLIDESDLLLHVSREPRSFSAPVSGTMTAHLRTLRPSASMQELREILDHGLTAVICDDDRFYGLITRFDLLNHLRRTLS
jgi:cystathionine beta-synthase